MRGEECHIVGDRAFDPLRPDGQVAKFPPLKFGALPCDRAIVRRWREQLFHNRRAPFIDKINSAFVVPRGRKRSAIAYPLALCLLELALPVEAGAPVTRRMAGEPPRIAARNSDPGIFTGFSQWQRIRTLAPLCLAVACWAWARPGQRRKTE
jgi:hypothetical protein